MRGSEAGSTRTRVHRGNSRAPMVPVMFAAKCSEVGNFPGRALSFAVRKGGEPRVISFPSKSVAWQIIYMAAQLN